MKPGKGWKHVCFRKLFLCLLYLTGYTSRIRAVSGGRPVHRSGIPIPCSPMGGAVPDSLLVYLNLLRLPGQRNAAIRPFAVVFLLLFGVSGDLVPGGLFLHALPHGRHLRIRRIHRRSRG